MSKRKKNKKIKKSLKLIARLLIAFGTFLAGLGTYLEALK